jgi:hypothetical protein
LETAEEAIGSTCDVYITIMRTEASVANHTLEATAMKEQISIQFLGRIDRGRKCA